MQKKILVCGPRAKSEMTGVTLAVELLIQGLIDAKVPNLLVDTTFFNRRVKSGTFSSLRAIETLLVILRVWITLPSCNIYYATMSTSPLGFIRDYLTVGVAKLLGRRTVLHLHGGGFEDFYITGKPWLQRMIRANLRRTNTIVVLGELLKEQFECVGDFVKPKLKVVPNGLTLGVDEPDEVCKTLVEGQRVELLYLSSLMPSKGFFDVLMAMALLEKESPQRFHLNLCGSFVDAKTETAVEVHDEVTLHAYIKENGLEEYVTYHGQVVGKQKEKQFTQANIFLLPTSYPWEGQPLSIIEALAFSIPVISCNHKGIPEMVESGRTGLFVKPKAPRSIASAIIDITEDSGRYSNMSLAAREHYEANFKRDVHLDQLTRAIYGKGH